MQCKRKKKIERKNTKKYEEARVRNEKCELMVNVVNFPSLHFRHKDDVFFVAVVIHELVNKLEVSF
jgi:hypothetical protein